MDEYVWPNIGPEAAAKIQEAWPATCEALPVGKRITATVIGRQPFGVFVRIHGVPDAVGLAELVGMPRDFELPQLGAQVEGHIADHVERNHQVWMALDGWMPPLNDSSASGCKPEALQGNLYVSASPSLPSALRFSSSEA